MKSTQVLYIIRDTKNLAFCGGSYNLSKSNICTNRWYLDKLEPNNKKDNNDKISD